MRKFLSTLPIALALTVAALTSPTTDPAAAETLADIQAEAGEEFKIVGEVLAFRENSFTYMYCETPIRRGRAVSGYFQFFRQQKFWKAPVFLHAEFRTFVTKDFDTDNIYMAGGAWNFLTTSRGTVALELLYRYDGRSNYQLTLAANWAKGRWSYAGYADFFGPSTLHIFSENKMFADIYAGLALGVNLELGLRTVGDHTLSCRPFAAARYSF